MKRRSTYRAIYRTMMPALLLGLAMILQSLAPSIAAAQRGYDFDISAYLCNQTAPTNQQAASEAEAALADILRLAGKVAPDNSDHEKSPHCQFCMVNIAAITPPSLDLAAPQIYSSAASPLKRAELQPSRQATGPPLGGRAPPFLF